jgi:adenylate cyclase
MDEAKQLMNADRSTLWLIDRDRHDLWTQISMGNGTTKELRVPWAWAMPDMWLKLAMC